MPIAIKVSPSDCDLRQRPTTVMAMWLPKPEVFIFYVCLYIKANLGFSTIRSARRNCPRCYNDQHPEMTIWTFWAPFCHFRSSSSQSLGYALFSFVVVDHVGFAVGILMILVLSYFRRCINTSGLCGHIATLLFSFVHRLRKYCL